MSNRIVRPIVLAGLPGSTLVTALAATAAVVAPPAAVGAESPGVDCAEWHHDDFDAAVERLDASTVRLTMTYADTDPLGVCPFTVFHSLRYGDGDAITAGSVSAVTVAADTASTVGGYVVDMAHSGCDWEVWIGIEEGLPIVLDGTDSCWSTPIGPDWLVTPVIEPRWSIDPVRRIPHLPVSIARR